MRGQRQCRIVLFISANTSGADGTNSKVQKSSMATELLNLKYNRVYLSVDSRFQTFSNTHFQTSRKFQENFCKLRSCFTKRRKRQLLLFVVCSIEVVVVTVVVTMLLSLLVDTTGVVVPGPGWLWLCFLQFELRWWWWPRPAHTCSICVNIVVRKRAEFGTI